MRAATKQGLGTCWIGAFYEKEVKKIIRAPENIRIVALTPLGYSNEQGRVRSRKQVGQIISYNKY